LGAEGTQVSALHLSEKPSPVFAVPFKPSRRFLELLEPDRQSVTIRAILTPSRPANQCANDPLQTEFEKWTIVDFEQPIRDMDAEIGVNPDQVSIEGGMMDFRQRQAIRDDRLSKLLVRIHDDVSGIEEPRLGQM
jgi:hypothetical protein